MIFLFLFIFLFFHKVNADFFQNPKSSSYYIKNYGLDYKKNINVTGTELDPFANLEEGFDKINLLLSEKFNETIFVFLMDNYYYYISSQKDYPKEYFKTANNLTIYFLPYSCKQTKNIFNVDDIVSYLNKKNIPKIRFNIFTPNFFFKVDNIHFFMLNIEFYGGDLVIFNFILENETDLNFEKMTTFITICYMNPDGCCSSNKLSNYKIDQKYCLYDSEVLFTRNISKLLNFFQISDDHLFELESKSKLILSNVEFKYLKSFSRSSFFYEGLIDINSKKATVVLNEVNFEENYFPSGLIGVRNVNNALSTEIQKLIYISNIRISNQMKDKFSESFSTNLFLFNLYMSEIYFQNVTIEFSNFIQSKDSKVSIENLIITQGFLKGILFFFEKNNSVYLNNITTSYLELKNSIIFDCGDENTFILNNSQFKNITVSYFLVINDNSNINISTTIFQSIEMTVGNFMGFRANNTIYINNIIILNMNQQDDKGLIELENTNHIFISQSNFTNMIVMTASSTPPFCLGIDNWITMDQSYLDRIYSISKLYKPIFSFYLVEMNVFLSYNNVFKNCSTINFDYSNEIEITNSIFVNFRSDNEGGVFTFFHSNYLNMFNSQFSESFAKTGGALWLGYYNFINIFDSLFYKLFSNICGGIAYLNSKNRLVMHNSQFYNTTSILDGGSFYFFSENFIYFYSSYFENSSSTHGTGGYIYMEEENTILISDTFIKDSYAKKDGGLIFSSRGGSIKLINSIIHNSSALNGGILFSDDSSVIIIKTCYFATSKAGKDGGIFFIRENSTISIENSYFYNSFSESSGGALNFDQNSIIVIKTSFIGNSVSKNQPGGCIYSNFRNTFSIENVIFYNCSTSADAGALYLYENNKIQMNNSIIIEAKCIWEGGGISFNYKNEGKIINSKFKKLFSVNRGGAMFFESENKLLIENCSFHGISSNENGGVFFLSSNNALEINQSEILHCKSESNGLIIFSLQNNTIFLESMKISKNEIETSKEFKSESKMSYESTTVPIISKNPFISINNHSTLTIKNSTWSSIKGPSLILISSSNFSLENCQFKKIQTGWYMIHLKNENGNKVDMIEFENVYFSKIDAKIILFSEEISIYLKNLKVYLDHEKNLFAKIFNSQKLLIEDSVFKLKINNTKKLKLLLSKSVLLFELEKRAGFIEIKKSLTVISGSSFINGRGKDGGAVYSEDSIISITKSNFIQNKAKKYGGAICIKLPLFPPNNSYTIIIDQVVGIMNKAESGGMIAVFDENIGFNLKGRAERHLKIKLCRFTLNTALTQGGVIFSSNFESITILNSSFYLNSVSFKQNLLVNGKGGTIFVSGRNDNNLPKEKTKDSFLKLVLLNNTFNLNKAFAGGIFFSKNLKTIIKDQKNLFNQNFVSGYGTIYASEVTHYDYSSGLLKFNNKSKNTREEDISIFINEIVSGRIYTECLAYLFPFDYFNQTCYGTEETYAPLEQNEFYNFTFINETGAYCLKGMITRLPNPQSKFINEHSIKINKTDYTPSRQLNIQFKFRNCQMGERLTEDNKCIECPYNTYSFVKIFDHTSELCKPCIDKPFKCNGGNNLSPFPGYWRISKESDNFIRCPFPEACLGWEEKSDEKGMKNSKINTDAMYVGECAKGYDGILCAECAKGYGKDANKKFRCSTCNSFKQITWLVVLVILKTFFILWSIHQAIEMCLTISSDSVDMNKVITNNLIKMIFNHFQTLTLIFALPINWPFSINDTEFVAFFSNSITDSLSYECVIENSFPENWKNFPAHYFRLLMNWVHPIFLVCLCMIYIKIYARFFGNEYIKNLVKEKPLDFFKHLFQPLYFIVLSIYFCQCIEIVLQTFSCVNVGYEGNPYYVILADVSAICWNDQHYNYRIKVALPHAIIFGISFPILIFFILHRKWRQNALDDKKCLFKYGYFYYGLDHNFFYWDLVILLRKVLITAAYIFYMTNINNPQNYILLIVFLIIIVALYFQIYFKPYRKEKLNIMNELETKSLIALAGSLYIGIFSLQFEEVSESVGFFLFMSIIFINCYFIYYWGKAFFVYNLLILYSEIRSFLFKKINFKSQNLSNESFEVLSEYTPPPKKKSIRSSRKTKLGLLFKDCEFKEQETIPSSLSIEIKKNVLEMYYEEQLKISLENLENLDEEKKERENEIATPKNIKTGRRGGLAMNENDKNLIKRKLLFYDIEFLNHDINLIKKYCFSKESPIFIIKDNIEDFPDSPDFSADNLKMTLTLNQSYDGLLKFELKIKNLTNSEVYALKINFKENNDFVISCNYPLDRKTNILFNEEINILIMVKFINTPFNLIVAELEMSICNFERKTIILLPSSINNFLKSESINEKNFLKLWTKRNKSISVLGPYSNDRMNIRKEDFSKVFNGKLTQQSVPYYRRETDIIKVLEAKEIFFVLLDLKLERRAFLLKIKRNEIETTFKFCDLENYNKKIQDQWRDFNFYEGFVYLFLKD